MPAPAALTELTPKHEAIINWMLANPMAKPTECAEHFGVTVNWIASVTHSDLFKERMAKRQAAIADKVDDTLITNLEGLATLTTRTLISRVRANGGSPAQLPNQDLVSILETALKALGLTNQAKQAPGAQVNVFAVPPRTLEEARSRMAVIDATPKELPPGGERTVGGPR